MNNYEDLPQIIPSDIDFSIPPELFRRLDGFIFDFAEAKGAEIVQKLWHGNMKCAYILATGPGRAREFVQLDFFTAFSTKGCPSLIPHEDLVADRKRLRNFYVPRPEVELLFTAMRRLFKNDWSARHCARISELSERIRDTGWLPDRYAWMKPTLEAAIRGEVERVAERRPQDWARLRSTAVSNLLLPERVAHIWVQTKRIFVRLRDETGQLLVLAAPRESIGTSALETLELVFHRRLFLEGRASLLSFAKLALLKRRKGLIIVMAGPDHPEGQALAKRLRRFGLLDQMLFSDNKLHPLDRGMAGTAFADDSGFIDAIVRVQAAKAARAIARGGTQTSEGLS
ncbi:hypothetical protein N8I71_13025 [Roseibacterium sp. SDUM158016]|uniref:hypothetical protein n=1 Tax=Roseicyclus sediminis TaxID=2980997 RepID=UPI0021D277D4|nr:hypothetical protein [Roseibacterium sp. SDUM158016]MCU4653760.1 hypothetical protein [Roseibacterium sp. SDUM158016]